MPAQYTSLAFTEALTDAGITGSIGTVGDVFDNALMESTIGLFKTEVISHEQKVQWFKHERLHSSIGDVPPSHYYTTRGHDDPVAA